MTYGGYGGGPTGPYGNDPFGGQQGGGQQGGYGQQGGGQGFPPPGGPGGQGGGFGPPGGQGFPPGPPGGPPGFPPGPPGFGPQYPMGPQSGQTNTLATLSMPFGFVLPPVGVVMGHMALSQTKKTGQPGRQRALIGLTIGYVMIFVWIVVLVVWLVLGNNSDSSSDQTSTTTTSKTTTSKKKTTTSRTTTRRPSPTQPAPPIGSVSIEDLQPGDCVMVVEAGGPDSSGKTGVTMSRFPCVAGANIYRVVNLGSSSSVCTTGTYISNSNETLFACMEPVR